MLKWNLPALLEKINFNTNIRAITCVVALFLFCVSVYGEEKLKAIKEAENLTLMQDRFLACSTLLKAYKKETGKNKKILKDQLFYFSKNFYTEKGFQLYLNGKELLAKKKYTEASDALIEADLLEKNNIEILHKLSMSLMWSKKYKEAQEHLEKALGINPLDIELHKTRVALEFAQDNWKEVQLLVEQLAKEGFVLNSQLQYFKIISQVKLLKKEEAAKILETVLIKYKTYPDIYYFYAETQQDAKKEKALQEYADLCKNKVYDERDINLCQRQK